MGEDKSKRELFTGGAPGVKKRRGKIALAAGAVAVLALAAVFFVMSQDRTGATPVTAENGLVKVPLAQVMDGAAHFYSYKAANGKTVRFFVMRSSDGVMRAALDTCDVCYPAKKGYRQEGEYMVCNNCGLKFHSSGINEIKGGCNPMPLERGTDGCCVMVRAADLEAGAAYF